MSIIQIVDGDIFQNKELDVIVHQANCFHTMGAGIAKKIKSLFPEAYEADLQTPYGEIEKLGSFSETFIPRMNDNKGGWIVNLYSQFNFDASKRQTNYEAMKSGFQLIDGTWNSCVIGVPYGIGCGLAGGDWNIVLDLITRSFKRNDVMICRL